MVPWPPPSTCGTTRAMTVTRTPPMAGRSHCGTGTLFKRRSDQVTERMASTLKAAASTPSSANSQ